MAKLTEQEAELVKNIQKSIRKAKQNLGIAERALTDLMDIQHEAGRLEAEAAAMGFRSGIRGALSEMDRGHALGSLGLCQCYANGGEIVALGGGGR